MISNPQGLLVLFSGMSLYTILLLSFRLITTQSEEKNDVSEETSGWHSSEELVIVDIIEETSDIKSFYFKRKNEKKMTSFSPGQFLSFQIKDDKKLLRSYSISGSCENNSSLQVSIKVLKDGVGSGWFHSLSIGDIVWAYPPGGLFTDNALKAEAQRIYIGGGIGITPLLSMIKTNIDRVTKTPMHLFYGMNSINDMAFHDELVLLSERYNHFSYHPILSTSDESWSGDSGYISYDYIKSKTTIEKNTNVFFCGPPIMTEGITDSLIENGHPESKIHSEKFASPVAFDPDNIPHREAVVEINGKTLNYAGKESLLEFAEDNDIEIPFACRSGVCGACKVKLKDGEVDSFTDSGLTSQEIKSGQILACVSRPVSNIKIEES